MKKLFTIMLMMAVAIAASAQEKNDSLKDISMNRTFSVGGKAIMCMRSSSMDKRDLRALTWTLENKRVSDDNFVTLKIMDAKTGQIEEIKTWSETVDIAMRVNEKNDSRSYFVYDDMFYHLRLIDLGKNVYVIMLYSDLKNSQQKVR